jgi:N-acyl-D-aspartate/D-glutamate deacylase
MEGVEEIPAPVLREGLKWNWQTFPEYLDALDSLPRSFDLAALLPHGALRFYVMGDEAFANKCATGATLARMTSLTADAMRAGAFGLSTSRTRAHRLLSGEMTPDYHVAKPELLALACEVAAHKGILECSPDGLTAGGEIDVIEREMKLFDELVNEAGVDFHFITVQAMRLPGYWRKQMEWAAQIKKAGKNAAYALTSGRAIGLYFGFFGMHPFMDCPTFKKIESTLPREAWRAELAKPHVKSALLAETNPPETLGDDLSKCWNDVYLTGAATSPEPEDERKLIHEARRQQRDIAAVGYDLMLASDKAPRLVLLAANYSGGSLDELGEMLKSPGSLLSLSDAGAHLTSICDGNLHTFMLSHWTRDRSRGPKLALEEVVRKMTMDCAQAFHMRDRGMIAPGLKADINVIDLDKLHIAPPHYIHDLPARGMRLMQKVSGYRATIVSGVVTRENDAPTGALPGRVVRHNKVMSADGP